MLLILLLAPLLTAGCVRSRPRCCVDAGRPCWQPYRDLLKLLRKEVVLADSASWLFRVAPYLIFAAIWVAASLVPPSLAACCSIGPRFDRHCRPARHRRFFWRWPAWMSAPVSAGLLQPRNDDRLAG